MPGWPYSATSRRPGNTTWPPPGSSTPVAAVATRAASRWSGPNAAPAATTCSGVLRQRGDRRAVGPRIGAGDRDHRRPGGPGGRARRGDRRRQHRVRSRRDQHGHPGQRRRCRRRRQVVGGGDHVDVVGKADRTRGGPQHQRGARAEPVHLVAERAGVRCRLGGGESSTGACRRSACSTACATAPESSTGAMTTTGAEANSVVETAPASSSGDCSSRSTVESVGVRTSAGAASTELPASSGGPPAVVRGGGAPGEGDRQHERGRPGPVPVHCRADGHAIPLVVGRCDIAPAACRPSTVEDGSRSLGTPGEFRLSWHHHPSITVSQLLVWPAVGRRTVTTSHPGGPAAEDDVLVRAARTFVGMSVRAADRLGPVSLVQLRALTVIDEIDGANLVQLSDGMGVTVSTASRSGRPTRRRGPDRPPSVRGHASRDHHQR